MTTSRQTGLFGKLPAHGDFVHRNLPAGFVNRWDEWLQHFVAATREQIGEHWLEVYLTSPIWRFVFSDGVIDDGAWMGIVMPSVDRVGRYFPFSVVSRIGAGINPLEPIVTHADWFDGVEELALKALDGQLPIDDLMAATAELPMPARPDGYTRDARADAGQAAAVLNLDFEEQSPASVFPYFLDSLLVASWSSYSAWSTRGSEHLAPCVMLTRGLPPLNGVAAMMDGQWQHWNWQQPYRLDSLDNQTFNNG